MAESYLAAIDEALAEVDERQAALDAELGEARDQLAAVETKARELAETRARIVSARDILTGDRPVPPKYTRRPKTPARPAGDAELQCPDCGQTFANAAGLGSHRRTHGRRTPASQPATTSNLPVTIGCPEPGCDWEGQSRAELSRHRREASHYAEDDE